MQVSLKAKSVALRAPAHDATGLPEVISRSIQVGGVIRHVRSYRALRLQRAIGRID